MSYRRAISFKKTELDLLKYFDENGKAEIAKAAMKFYKENRYKIMVGTVKDIIELLPKEKNAQK